MSGEASNSGALDTPKLNAAQKNTLWSEMVKMAKEVWRKRGVELPPDSPAFYSVPWKDFTQEQWTSLWTAYRVRGMPFCAGDRDSAHLRKTTLPNQKRIAIKAMREVEKAAWEPWLKAAAEVLGPCAWPPPSAADAAADPADSDGEADESLHPPQASTLHPPQASTLHPPQASTLHPPPPPPPPASTLLKRRQAELLQLKILRESAKKRQRRAEIRDLEVSAALKSQELKDKAAQAAAQLEDILASTTFKRAQATLMETQAYHERVKIFVALREAQLPIPESLSLTDFPS